MKYLKNQKMTKSNLVLELFKEFIFEKKFENKIFFGSTFRNFRGLFRDQNDFLQIKAIYILKVLFKTFHLTPLPGLSEFCQKSSSREGGGRGLWFSDSRILP